MNKRKTILIGIGILLLIITIFILCKTLFFKESKYMYGDEITVQVNDTEFLLFNVIEYNNKEITLLSQNVMPISEFHTSSTCNNNVNTGCTNIYESSSIKKELSKIKANWKNIKSIRMLTLNEVIYSGDFTITENTNPITYKYTNYFAPWILTNIKNNEGYWLEDADYLNKNTSKKVWALYNIQDDSNNQAILKNATVQTKLYIKPVITISTEYIIED